MKDWPKDFKTFAAAQEWLKKRRDQYPNNSPKEQPSSAWLAINDLLDELREAGVEGRLPWQ